MSFYLSEEADLIFAYCKAESSKAFQSFISEIAQDFYALLRDAVNKLATADCLLSLAQVALQANYVQPEFTDDNVLEIIDGRHPMVETLSSDPYMPNSIKMGDGEAMSKVITGPNMGGSVLFSGFTFLVSFSLDTSSKSCCVRMIALIALMAQIGSYVPAASVKIGLLDSILTRMGGMSAILIDHDGSTKIFSKASDDLARGRSTFMVEMSETSEILHTATKNSLVILDELGRGTSTFDGVRINKIILRWS